MVSRRRDVVVVVQSSTVETRLYGGRVCCGDEGEWACTVMTRRAHECMYLCQRVRLGCNLSCMVSMPGQRSKKGWPFSGGVGGW